MQLRRSAAQEVAGTDLDYKKDRVLLIDCTGTCGVSDPATGVTQPGAAVTAALRNPRERRRLLSLLFIFSQITRMKKMYSSGSKAAIEIILSRYPQPTIQNGK